MANDNSVIIHIKARDDASKHIDGLGDKFGGLGKAAAIGAGAGVAALGALGFMAGSAAADFEKSMSEIKAVSGATGEQLMALDALALQLGKDTSFSAKEAADGMAELVKGGVGIEDILNGAAGAMLNLAAAGEVKLPEAAEIASNAMAMFGLGGEDMAHVADLIAGAANASSLSVSDFRFSLAAAGAVARTAGQRFDDVAVAIAVLGKQGLKGSDAGTSLKTMLMNLIPSTKKATEEMQRLGIVTADGANRFVDANGKIRSMAEIAGVLEEATRDLTEAERLQSLEIIFGSDAIRAAAILAREGASGFDAMATAMGKVTAAEVASVKLDNLRGSLEQLSGSWDTMLITLGKSSLGPVRGVVDWATGTLNGLTEAIEGKGFVGGLIGAITGHLQRGEWDQVGALLGTLIGDAASSLGDEIQKLAPDIARSLAGWIEELKGWPAKAWPGLRTNLDLLVDKTGAFLKAEGPPALRQLIAGWVEAQPSVNKLAEGIGEELGRAIIRGVRGSIGEVRQAFMDLVRDGFGAAGNQADQDRLGLIIKLMYPFTETSRLTIGLFRGMASELGLSFDGIGAAIYGQIRPWLERIASTIDDVTRAIRGLQEALGAAPRAPALQGDILGPPAPGPATGGTYWDPSTQSYQPARGYASGGILSEPIFGRGLRSGRGYTFGESGPEMVTPLSGGSRGGMSINGPLVSIGSIEVHDQADEERLVNRLQEALAQTIGQYARFPMGLARTV